MVEEIYKISVRKGEVEVAVEGAEKEFVEKKVEELISRIIEGKVPTEQEEEMEGVVELRKFFKEKAPRKHTEFILVLGYWHQIVEGKGEFTTKILTTLYDKINIPPPENLNSQLFRLAHSERPTLKKGSKRGRYLLNEHGRALVEMLPQRPKRRRK